MSDHLYDTEHRVELCEPPRQSTTSTGDTTGLTAAGEGAAAAAAKGGGRHHVFLIVSAKGGTADFKNPECHSDRGHPKPCNRHWKYFLLQVIFSSKRRNLPDTMPQLGFCDSACTKVQTINATNFATSLLLHTRASGFVGRGLQARRAAAAAAAAQLLKVVVKRIARQKPVASRPPSSGDEFESEAESGKRREGS